MTVAILICLRTNKLFRFRLDDGIAWGAECKHIAVTYGNTGSALGQMI